MTYLESQFQQPSYSLVLSGGGARGLAHVGVLAALEELGIKITEVAGSSIGAVVGAFYCAGYSPKEILEFFSSHSLFALKRYSLKKPGFLDTSQFRGLFEEYLPSSFSDLKLPLIFNATNLNRGEEVLFSDGPLIRPLLASAAFPGVFSAVKIDQEIYADGGIINNFPIEHLRNKSNPILGVYVNPLNYKPNDKLRSTLAVLERAYKISRNHNSINKFDQCQFVVHPFQLEEYNFLQTSNLEKIFDIGYEAAYQSLYHPIQNSM